MSGYSRFRYSGDLKNKNMRAVRLHNLDAPARPPKMNGVKNSKRKQLADAVRKTRNSFSK